MKSFSLFLLLILMVGTVKSQSDITVERNQFKINFLYPGLIYERGISKNSTLRAEFATFFRFSSDSENRNLIAVFPLFDGQYRYYYNFQRRESKGKKISGNSGNFLGMQTFYLSQNPILGKYERSFIDFFWITPGGFEIFFIGPTYGLQRTYPSGFNLELQFVLGYFDVNERTIDEIIANSSGIFPGVSFSIGWVLGKRKTNPKSPQNQQDKNNTLFYGTQKNSSTFAPEISTGS